MKTYIKFYSIMILINFMFYNLPLYSQAVTNQLEHKEGYTYAILSNPNVDPNQLSVSEIIRSNEIPSYAFEQKNNFKELKILQIELNRINEDYLSLSDDEKKKQKSQLEEKYNQVKLKINNFDLALQITLKLPIVNADQIEKHLAKNMRTINRQMPFSLLKDAFRDVHYISYDEDKNSIIFSYFGYYNKFVGYSKEKIGESTRTDGNALINQYHTSDSSSSANVSYQENSYTLNIYNTYSVYKIIKVKKDFIINIKTGRIDDIINWQEYDW